VNLFVTGTDTNVGKTHVAAMLVRALRKAGMDCVAMKPICCGSREDAEILRDAADGAIELNDVNPVWLRTPAAPYTAGMVENRAIDLALIRGTFARLRAAHRSVIVEGVGGWMVPITREYFVRDLAVEFALPVAIVVANRLGAINHTVLTVDSIRASGLECAGLIHNNPIVQPESDEVANVTNRSVIEDLTEVPILFDIAHGQTELTVALA